MNKKKLYWCLGALLLALGLTAFVYFWHTRRANSTTHIEDTDGPTTIFISDRDPNHCKRCMEKIALGVVTVINRLRYYRAE